MYIRVWMQADLFIVQPALADRIFEEKNKN
jgi:hypothetical protein